MKLFTVFNMTMLSAVLFLGALGFAQDTRPAQEEAKPEAQEPAKPAQPEAARPERPENDKNAKQEEKQQPKEEQKEDKNAERHPEEHAAPANNEHTHPADARSGQRAHIPDEQFHAHFGREHTFRIGHPTVVEGQPRFQYGGYTFVMVDPWPVGWGYDDMVYVDYIDGVYYLIDPMHPGVQIVVNVIL